jgi:hypothetical protein
MAFLPAVPYVILGVEAMFKHGSGPAKKQAVTSALADMINIFSQANGGQSSTANSSVMSLVDDLIEEFVKMFNADGTFTHGAK